METVFIWASKLLPLAVYPVGITLLLLLAALGALMLDRKDLGLRFLLAGFVVFWFSSTPIFAEKLFRAIESRVPPLAFEEIPARGCTVLMGGIVNPARSPRLTADFNEYIDRMLMTWRLYEAGKTNTIVIVDGHLPWEDAGQSEAEVIRDLLVELGVPERSMRTDNQGRNSRENAVQAKLLMRQADCGAALLISSAITMPRQLALFRKLGVDVVPVVTDVHYVDDAMTIFDWLPSSHGIAMTSWAMTEYLGLVVYRLRGWI